ncbi:unnamed protein product [Zymoseptoria tritici ST99CH_3D1]|nr:unnamed protein product [Zymoseptoria tritici ST99CH_3D1]
MSTIKPLATFTPACTARTWSSQPHPHLPILATACSDKTVRIYDLKSFTQQSVISGGHKRSVRAVAWKDTGKGESGGESVLATGSFDASAGIWKRWENAQRAAGKQQSNGDTDGDEIDFTGGLAGGNASDDEENEWRLEVILDGHDSEIKSLAFCPTAPLLATCSRDKSVWIWEELDDGENFETMAVLQDHEGDVKCVAWHPTEQLLASGSYDDRVRLWREDSDDWACCALLSGHEGTVWFVEWEPTVNVGKVGSDKEDRERAGPRLLSCSDDTTIRVWRRRPREKKDGALGQGKVASIWKNSEFEEDWFEEDRLPKVHERPVYSVSWSAKSGLVVSTGSDGKIVVYREVEVSGKEDVEMSDDASPPSASSTKWVVVAEWENAHDVFEVNHAVWAPRVDKGKRFEDEEVIVTTGDDGEVKVWTLDGE